MMSQMKLSMKSTRMKKMKIEHVYFFNNFTAVDDYLGGKMTFVKN